MGARMIIIGKQALIIAMLQLLFLSNAIPADTPLPTDVTIAGSLQSEVGCSGDWQPDCAATHLTFDADDQAWQETFTIPAGSWEYKAALNNSWDESYGLNATRNGANIPLNISQSTDVKFYYSHETHWVTSRLNSVIAVAAGSFQSELGCSGDWQPDCFRSWLQDPDGDGTYTFSTRGLPAGNYEVRATINESWDENYGAGGVRNGSNIPFTVATDCAATLFNYNSATHMLTVNAGTPAPQPASVTIAGNLQSEVGCPGDWQPDCSATHLSFDAVDQVWQETFNIPAGSWEYKAALNNSWDENYGLNATLNGANIPLDHSQAPYAKFYYSHETNWVTSNLNSVIAVAPGNFQSELGCSGDWQPDCLRSWLQDPDGDGLYTFTARGLPAGNYEVKVAINESWSENYGAGGVRDGANISFSVPEACQDILFSYNAATHVLTVSTGTELMGPKTSNVSGNPNPVPLTGSVVLTADIDDSLTGNSVISAAHFSINNGGWVAMASLNGFDTPTESVTASFVLANAGITAPGVYNLCIRGSDMYDNIGEPKCTLLIVYDPAGGFISGGGWIYSPAGAYLPYQLPNPDFEGKAEFGFVSKYGKGAATPSGTTEFAFRAADLYFYSTEYDWLVVNQAATNAQFKGTGSINGQGNYKFMLWAGDGLPDTFRIRIWLESEAGIEDVVYDNGSNQPIGAGRIIIHKR